MDRLICSSLDAFLKIDEVEQTDVSISGHLCIGLTYIGENLRFLFSPLSSWWHHTHIHSRPKVLLMSGSLVSTFVALLIASLICSAIALLSLEKPEGKRTLLARLLTAAKRYNASNQLFRTASTSSKALDDRNPVKYDHEHDSAEMSVHKDMYYKLHNLEEFPGVLSAARNQLIAFFAETLDTAFKERPHDSILNLDTYSREGLIAFMRDRDEQVNHQWEEYVGRRRKGGPTELFKDQDGARWWLRQIAPTKYVDGAWLGYINDTTLPFALRDVIKNSWQVLSEELGDGDLDKNHAQVYRELMKSVTLDLPAADTAEFILPQQGMNQPAVWKSALTQLLISLTPHEFLPEILGFNMHFEALTLETLKASRELKEVGLDPYYFVLHVSIDNADSGHTAIAQQAVCIYIEYIHRTEGASAAQQAWRRVQVGYTLSDGLPSSIKKPAVDVFPRNKLEAEVIRIFRAKALVGHKIHNHSIIKIGGRKLLDWLDPLNLGSQRWQMDFLDSFSHSKPWVCRGDSNKSQFVKELLWGGRMFGAFTQTETDVVKRWIDAMPSSNPQRYWDFLGREGDLTSLTGARIDRSFDRPNIQSLQVLDSLSGTAVYSRLELPAAPFKLNFGATRRPNAAKFFPLWFTHPCLLERFVSIPWKATNPFVCSVVKILRAQAGFDNESESVAGMDEASKTDSVGLVEIGQELLRHWGYPQVGSLKEVLEKWDSQPATAMAHLAMRPFSNKGLLIGMAVGFTCLHGELASSHLLCLGSQEALCDITRRETENLEQCLEKLDADERRHCSRGYWFVAAQLGGCFGNTQKQI